MNQNLDFEIKLDLIQFLGKHVRIAYLKILIRKEINKTKLYENNKNKNKKMGR